MKVQKTIGELNWCTNLRGEVDQSINKSLITGAKTKLPLVRGDHLGKYSFKHVSNSKKPSYIDDDLFHSEFAGKSKAKAHEKNRIVGRQCSYASSYRRLIFARVLPGFCVGNSCNYLTVDNSSETVFEVLLGVLNSAIIDWFFCVQNSNNHVGNYEIDRFPFPTNENMFPQICTLVRMLEQQKLANDEQESKIEAILEAYIAASFEITFEELEILLKKFKKPFKREVFNYFKHISRMKRSPVALETGKFFNNEMPSLSELDREILSHVPEGGNWQDIPDTVPSKRLEQIREMTAKRGVVRTTYYGRLRLDQPAYTINTYFNRPGNGTHIHPTLPRTLTAREAARIQTFPDNFIFCGSQASVRNQIGNAVPPLLAKAIGSHLFDQSGENTLVDMFCGAGGLSYGLVKSGWRSIAAIDYDEDSLDTYSLNHQSDYEPKNIRQGFTGVFRRDLHLTENLEEISNKIETFLDGKRLDLLAGGPPCQGFSHAGFRLENDQRNDLSITYLKFAYRLRPKIFLLENVEGLLSMKKGRVLNEIVETLQSFGYRVSTPVWRLFAEEFGVPQMRRRVFVVASLDPNVNLSPPSASHRRCPGRRKGVELNLFDSDLSEAVTIQDALETLSLEPKDKLHKIQRWYQEAEF